MDAAYIKSNVSGALTQGLAAAARLQPADPIDFLGRWLINHANALDKSAKLGPSTAHLEEFKHEVQGRQAAPASSSSSSSSAVAAAAPEAPAVDAAAVDSAIAALDACASVDADVLTTVANALKAGVGATAVYVAEKVAAKGGGGEEGGAGGGAVIKYLAASEGQDFIVEASVKEGEGATWKGWVRPEPAADAEEDAPPAEEGGEGEGAAGRPPKPPPELPLVHVPNVLRSGETVFHRLPRPGAFLACPLEYGSLLHEGALPPITAGADAPAEGDAAAAAAAAEDGGGKEGKEGGGEGEEGKEGEDGAAAAAAAAAAAGPRIAPGIPQPRFLALCADTLGQNRDFSAEQVAAVKRVTAALQGALERTDGAAYREEYLAAKAAVDAGAAGAAAATAELKASQDAAEGESSAAIAALPEGTAEEHKAHAKASALFRSHRAWLERGMPQLLALAARRIAPKPDVRALLSQAWFLLGATKESLGDPRAPDAAAFDWPVARLRLTEEGFGAALLAWDPESPAANAPVPPAGMSFVPAYHKPEAMRAALGGLTAESLAGEGGAFLALHAFLGAALDARDAFAARQKKVAEEEAEAKAKAEAEAAAKAAADAEAAAAAAAAAAEAAGAEGGGEAAEGGEEAAE